MHCSGMSSAPAMAPVSPGSSDGPLLTSAIKNTTFQSLGSLSAGMFSPALVRGAAHQDKKEPSPLTSPSPSIMSSPKLWHKASISRLAEEFFWIGGSVVAQPKWRLGQIGEFGALRHCCGCDFVPANTTGVGHAGKPEWIMGIWRGDNPLGLARLMCQVASLVSELETTSRGYLPAARSKKQHISLTHVEHVAFAAFCQVINIQGVD